MTPAEAAEVLGYAAAYDRRTVGAIDATAWAKALPDVTKDDAVEAVIEHYASTREWLMPSDIPALVRAIRRRRVEALLAGGQTPAPPVELDDDPAAGVRWQQAWIRAAGDGATVEQATGAADRVLDVVRRPVALSAHPTEALVAQLAANLRAPGTRNRPVEGREETA